MHTSVTVWGFPCGQLSGHSEDERRYSIQHNKAKQLEECYPFGSRCLAGTQKFDKQISAPEKGDGGHMVRQGILNRQLLQSLVWPCPPQLKLGVWCDTIPSQLDGANWCPLNHASRGLELAPHTMLLIHILISWPSSKVV